MLMLLTLMGGASAKVAAASKMKEYLESLQGQWLWRCCCHLWRGASAKVTVF